MTPGIPFAITPFGFGTPATAPPAADKVAALSRYINPGSGDYEIDGTHGQMKSMPTTRQRVLLIALTPHGSSTADRTLGIRWPRRMDQTFEAGARAAVRVAFAQLTTTERLIRIDNIEIERLSSGRARALISYVDRSRRLSMALEADSIYTPTGAAEIRDDFLTDVRLEARDIAGISQDEVDKLVRPKSDWHITGTALGNLGILQYNNIRIADIDSDVLTARGEALDRKREGLGLKEVPPSTSTGTMAALGPIPVLANDVLVLPNGLRVQVDGVAPGGTSSGVPIVSIDTGDDVNAEAGTVLRFVSPPVGWPAEAPLITALTGGADEETDERKRDRILNRLRHPPAGGNWGHVVGIALDASAAIQYTFVYPALGGPGSSKVVLVKDIDPDLWDFTRTPTDAQVNLVRQALYAELPSPMELVVQSAAGENADVAIKVAIPSAESSGGNGRGWVDEDPWPPLEGGDTKVTISVVTDSTNITVDATTTTTPVAGQSHIAWWSSVDQKFYKRLITAVSGGTGAWVLTLDAGLVDHNNAVAVVGEYISPDAVSIDEYGKTWQGVMSHLGPGENTVAAYALPRAARHPFPTEGWPTDLAVSELAKLLSEHGDTISNIDWSYRSITTPTVPGSVATAPNVLVPRHFGIYEL
jgi:hypothetical protein